MHIIINFINNHQRLPTSIKELRKTSHFYKDCHSLTEFLHSFNFFIYWRVSLLYYCNFVFHQEKIFKGIILIVLIILLEILLELLLEKKSYWLNFFLQLSNTTSHVDDDALYLAYFVAREWISRDYPEYLSEEWMQNSEFLDDVTRIH